MIFKEYVLRLSFTHTALAQRHKRAATKPLRLIFMFACIASLGACSVIPDFRSTSSQPETVSSAVPNTSEPSAAEQPAGSSLPTGESVPLMTPEQLILQDLRAKPDMYALSKRNLSPSVKATMLEALSAFKAKDFATSQNLVNRVINNELNVSSSVYVLAGDIALAQSEIEGESQQAVAHYRKALSINPDNAKAANRLAKLMRENGEFEQAYSLYTQAIKAQAMHAPSYRNRAVLNDLYLSQKAAALEDYQHYAALLSFQQTQVEQGTLVLADAEQKALDRNIKTVQGWLVDVERQVKALARSDAQAQTNNTSTSSIQISNAGGQ